MAAVAAGDRSAWLALFADNAVVEDPIGPSMFDPEGAGLVITLGPAGEGAGELVVPIPELEAEAALRWR